MDCEASNFRVGDGGRARRGGGMGKSAEAEAVGTGRERERECVGGGIQAAEGERLAKALNSHSSPTFDAVASRRAA